MKTTTKPLAITFLLMASAGAETPLSTTLVVIEQTIAQGPHKADRESLKKHTNPEWFRDAKFVTSLPGASGKISAISMLAHSGVLDWKQTAEALAVTLPKGHSQEHTVSFKIIADDLTPFMPGDAPGKQKP